MDAEPTTVFVNGIPVEVPAGAATTGDGPRVVARFTGPVRRTWAGRLESAGGRLEFWCPPHGACLTLGPSAAASVAALPFVAGFVPYGEELCERGLTPAQDAPAAWLDVICFSRAERPDVADRLRALGATVLDEAHAKLRIQWTGDPATIRDVVGVKLVERPSLPTVSAVGLAADVGVPAADGTWPTNLDGAKQTIGIVDTGLDTGVPATLTTDLRDRVADLRSWPINPSWAPYLTNPGADDGPADTDSGHGTFVAGLAAGTGGISQGHNRGVAPGATIVFQAIEQWLSVATGHPELGTSRFALAGRPTDLRDLLGYSQDHGATIHLNAWGSPARGAYDNDAYEADLFLWEHPDAVVLAAAGNGGSDANADRRPDPGSLESPATAKNILTIGATEGSAPNGFPWDWNRLQTGGRVFANPADLADPVAGQPDRMALLSAVGPTADGRTKPDVCAPGTCLVGPRSSVASGRGWGLADPLPHYVIDGGTSAAVAVAAGFTALLRQAWSRARAGRAPRGATLKALAVAGAAPVLSRDGTRPEDRSVCGFGRLDLAGSIPGGEGRPRILSDAAPSGGIRTAATRRFRVTAAQGGRLRAVLCWYDVPNERLVNDLDLTLTWPGGAAPVRGNQQADRTNTVEVIDVAGLPAGTWELTVTGVNVPQGPQPFALVIRTWAGQDNPQKGVGP